MSDLLTDKYYTRNIMFNDAEAKQDWKKYQKQNEKEGDRTICNEYARLKLCKQCLPNTHIADIVDDNLARKNFLQFSLKRHREYNF